MLAGDSYRAFLASKRLTAPSAGIDPATGAAGVVAERGDTGGSKRMIADAENTKTATAQWEQWLRKAATAERLTEVVAQWSLQTFGPGERFAGHVLHLQRELAELDRALGTRDAAQIADEAADVVILLMGLSARAGFDLIGAVRAKMEKNIHRRWAPADDDGVIEHVRDGRAD